MKRFFSALIGVLMTLQVVVFCTPGEVAFADSVVFGETISLNGYNSAVIKNDGSLWLWGSNSNGKIGNGTTTNPKTPVKIMDNVVSVSLGGNHSAAIKKDGSLWLWGDNTRGQIGDGTTTGQKTPVKIMDNVMSVSLGDDHSAAIKKDGSLWLWGWNLYGQLGDGTTTNQKIPVKIMDNVMSVSLGDNHSAAIKKDGSLWLWGWNVHGQLGDGTTTNQKTPVKIMDNVMSVSLGGEHSAAIKADGSLWLWGHGYYGNLGTGKNYSIEKPVKIMDNVISVSLGGSHSAAIKNDGSLWLWGRNIFGAIGNGTATNQNTPIKIMDNVASVSLGDFHSAAIKKDSSLWLWGHNDYNQIGDGTKKSQKTPIKIMDNVKLPTISTPSSSPASNEYTRLEISETTELSSYGVNTILFNGEKQNFNLSRVPVTVSTGSTAKIEAALSDEDGLSKYIFYHQGIPISSGIFSGKTGNIHLTFAVQAGNNDWELVIYDTYGISGSIYGVCTGETKVAEPTPTTPHSQTVSVKLPTFLIRINGGSVNNDYAKYPCIVYNGITYFPMTYYNSRALGLAGDWTAENGVVITKTGTAPYQPSFEQNYTPNSHTMTAQVVQMKVTVNGKVINNTAEEYPLLMMRDMIYFPLTWRFAVEEFGWSYEFVDPLGLLINSK